MNIGITGTREGANAAQLEAMEEVLTALHPHEFHHGDCMGVDAQGHKIASSLRCVTVIHPPVEKKYRAYCDGIELMAPKEYLDRNRDIVDMTEILIAVPSGPEVVRSGTWSTVRYALKKNKVVILINTDGEKVMM